VGVWARSSGNPADVPEATQGLSFTITPPPPLTVTSLTADKPSSQPIGTTITFTATASGGIAPQECKWFWTTDPTWATYSVLQTWQACTTTVPWTHTGPGSYQVGVWARSNGSTADAPQGSAGRAYEIAPDVRGTYIGRGSATNSVCANPIDNGTFPFTGSVAITTQTVQAFSGTGTFTTGDGSVSITIPGTVTGAG
jgi:hypothetical protein